MQSTAVVRSPHKSTNVRSKAEPWVLRLIRWSFETLGPVFPSAASAIALSIFFRPRKFATPARERRWLADARRETLSLGPWEVSIARFGRGPKVVLIHGWEGRASQMGGIARALAAAGFEAICVDAPAHGESSGRSVTLPDFVDVIERLAAREGPLAGLVGHSMGAAAVTVAAARGVDVARVVAISGPVLLTRVVESFATMLRLPPTVVDGFRDRMEKRFDPRMWNEFSPLCRAGDIEAPALIVHDLDDRDIPFHSAVELSSRWPNAVLVTTRELGHHRILRDRSVFAEVSHFLSAPNQSENES